MPRQEVERWFKKVEEKLAHAQHVECKVVYTTISANIDTELLWYTGTRHMDTAKSKYPITGYPKHPGRDTGRKIIDPDISGNRKSRLQKNIASQLGGNLSDNEDIIIRSGKLSDMLIEQVFTLAGCMRGISDPRLWENAIDELQGDIRNIRDMEDKKKIFGKAGKQLEELPNGEEWNEDSEKVSLMDNSISIVPQDMILPNSISGFEKLTVMLLSACFALKRLPSVLKRQALKKLDLSCSGIKEIPQGLEMLVNLKYLNLGDTRGLKDIPVGLLSKLCRLQYLAIHSILKNAEEMRELNKLEVFEGCFFNLGDLNMYACQRKLLYKHFILVCPLLYSGHNKYIPPASSKLVTFERIELNPRDVIILPYDVQQLHLKQCYGVRCLNDIGLRAAIDLKGCEVEFCDELETVFSSVISFGHSSI
ncbi:hypothetical protein F3Y22_tig00111445pilonHSYRG00135 [Hibiscus syriacus]|uniref:Uncharacterized protein n=1 Tax=Hibiscus syriacus TaxID=106335 RepID=A0A6A2Y359_HIBSY|nr:hypothetical protein F3Y22_tig00111445pilonHSYRG00135 [Hibiscus syriacus]